VVGQRLTCAVSHPRRDTDVAHGTPDWGVTSGAATVYQLTDLAELAARLGSPVTFDRRGDVLWIDDMESGVDKWYATYGGATGSLGLSAVEARNGRYSALLSAGIAVGASVNIYHYLPVPVFSSLGLEAHARLEDTLARLETALDLYDGTTELLGVLRYNHLTGDLLVLNAGEEYDVVATDLHLAAIARLFHAFKLVVDPVAQEYVRAIVDSTPVDLSGRSLYTLTTPVEARMDVRISQVSNMAATCNVYLDDVIVTQNEPA
jgi:hypothetical protein